MSIIKCKILSIKRAKIRKNDKKSLVFREIYSKFIIWGNYKNFHHALVACCTSGHLKSFGTKYTPLPKNLVVCRSMLYYVYYVVKKQIKTSSQ